MKKVIFGFIAAIALLLPLSLTALMIPRKKQPASKYVRREQISSPLTQAEEDDLRKLVPQTLQWVAMWIEPTNCLEGEKLAKLDFAETIKRHEGQALPMKLNINESRLAVTLDSLHLHLEFSRLHELGLSPARVYTFCENSYEAYNEKYRPAREEARRVMQSNPQVAARMEKMRETNPSSPETRAERREVRTYRVEPFVSLSVQIETGWSDEKKRLYDRVLEVVKRQSELYCSGSKTLTVAIPDFNVGDPEATVLFTLPSSERPALLIGFNRDRVNGEYTAERIKDFGLADELKQLLPKIKSRQAKELQIRCS